MASSKGKTLGIVASWLGIVFIVAVVVKIFVMPQIHKDKADQLAAATGSKATINETVKLALDSFSGYALFRSREFETLIESRGIRVALRDDGADYEKRMNDLKKGDVQFAIFPINSFIQTGVDIGSFPGTIVYVIDETSGADALVAGGGINDISDLNNKNAKIVLTPNSPSEFLWRIIQAKFQLPDMSSRHIREADGASDVYDEFKKTADDKPWAYCLWQPYVSKAIASGGVSLFTSKDARGFIVDVLVVNRKYLVDNEETVKHVVEAYSETAYLLKDDLPSVIRKDAKEFGEKVSKDQAEEMVDDILFKNTMENYAHFGLLRGSQSGGLQGIDDMIEKIVDVLVAVESIKDGAMDGKVHTLFYDQILSSMRADGFHPGKGTLSVLNKGQVEDEEIRAIVELKALTEQEWNDLMPVGALKIDPLKFGRGTAKLNITSERNIGKLTGTLQSFPYYLTVVGRTTDVGDPEANRTLAEGRSEAVKNVLISAGISEDRMRSKIEVGSGSSSVEFIVEQASF